MTNSIIEKEILIDASPDLVWHVFADRAVTRLMGGEYVTDWKPGSSIGWKGSGGKMYTHGKIIAVEPAKVLKHSLLNMEDKTTLISTITYTLKELNDQTLLSAREELATELTAEEYEEASEGWDAALLALKQIAEKI